METEPAIEDNVETRLAGVKNSDKKVKIQYREEIDSESRCHEVPIVVLDIRTKAA